MRNQVRMKGARGDEAKAGKSLKSVRGKGGSGMEKIRPGDDEVSGTDINQYVASGIFFLEIILFWELIPRLTLSGSMYCKILEMMGNFQIKKT